MMLTYEEEQAIRDDFEKRYAEHVKSWCGLDEPVQELVARIKLDRDGRRYKDDPTNNAWTGVSARSCAFAHVYAGFPGAAQP